jgi:hypothetical protein
MGPFRRPRRNGTMLVIGETSSYISNRQSRHSSISIEELERAISSQREANTITALTNDAHSNDTLPSHTVTERPSAVLDFGYDDADLNQIDPIIETQELNYSGN